MAGNIRSNLIDFKKILGVVKKVLPKSRALKNEVGLVFVSEKKMTEFNKKYRGRNKPTNVLSFDEGDIVICPKVVAREVKSYGFTQKSWMTQLIVHGILHLAGYEHGTVAARSLMERLEKKVLKNLGIVESLKLKVKS